MNHIIMEDFTLLDRSDCCQGTLPSARSLGMPMESELQCNVEQVSIVMVCLVKTGATML